MITLEIHLLLFLIPLACDNHFSETGRTDFPEANVESYR